MGKRRMQHPEARRKAKTLAPCVPLRPVWTISLKRVTGETEKRGTASSYQEALERVDALFAADSSGQYESAWVSWRGERK